MPIIKGRYVVRALLSAGGGSGEVYEVLDIHENEVVVLKLIRSVPTGNPWHEAQILRLLSDPHILPIRNADFAAGVPFIVTERATHGTLDTKLEAAPGLGVHIRDGIQWMRQASLGVARAHDVRLVHNDLKPGNLFLNGEGEALVGDFGGASLIPAGGTNAVPLQGTLETMAPEVSATYLSGDATASFASDTYSLGATTYWMLAGTTAHDFAGETDRAAMRQMVANNPSRPLRDVAPHVPQSVAAVIERALLRDPAARFQSAVDFAAAITRARLPDRSWQRVNVHPAHIGCWRGVPDGDGGAYLVCLERGLRPSQYEITSVHVGSGRRIARGCRTVPRRSWASGLRAVIRLLG